MSKRLKIIVSLLVIAVVMGGLVGCSEKYEPQSDEAGAKSYYNEKYGGSAEVSSSHALGSYALFGYNYYGMEYVMSDGNSVVYMDSKGEYKDNRQAAEIDEAMRAYVAGVLAKMPKAVITPEVERIGYENLSELYEGESICWHAKYDGDIVAFLKEEHPHISCTWHRGGELGNGNFSFCGAYDAKDGDAVEKNWIELAQLFDMTYECDIAVVDAQTFDAGQDGLFSDALKYVLFIEEDDAGNVSAVRYKPEFSEIMPNVSIALCRSSATSSVRASDVKMEDMGGGLWRCHVNGEVSEEEPWFYVDNRGSTITKVNDIDSFTDVCDAHDLQETNRFEDDEIYYVGDPADIKPAVDVLETAPDHVTVKYRTHFKDSIRRVQVKVIGLAHREGSSSSYETMEFPSKIIGEDDDGWTIRVDALSGAKEENTLYVQMSYNGNRDVDVQIEKDVAFK